MSHWRSKAVPMNVKPILFNTEMTQAILEDRKDVTRRIAFPNKDLRPFPRAEYPNGWWFRGRAFVDWDSFIGSRYEYDPCKYQPGNLLWVRETWCRWWMPHDEWHYCYKASDPNGNKRPTGPEYDDRWETRPWSPSLHMPKEAARIFLRVTDVKLQRLNDMSEEDAMHEGFPDGREEAIPPLARFSILWDKTVKREDIDQYGWNANPWVWAIEFERVDKPGREWADYCGLEYADGGAFAPAT